MLNPSFLNSTRSEPAARPPANSLPVSWRNFPALKLAVIECSGDVTDADWLDGFSRVWNDPAFDRSGDKLIDTRGIGRFGVSTGAIFRLGELAREIYAGCLPSKAAIVAPRAEIHGVARQYQIYSDGNPSHARVFWTYEAACAWLRKLPRY